MAHVNTDRHASAVTSPLRVAGSVFKAQKMRDVMWEITGKRREREVVFYIITDTNIQTAFKEEELQKEEHLNSYVFVYFL